VQVLVAEFGSGDGAGGPNAQPTPVHAPTPPVAPFFEPLRKTVSPLHAHASKTASTPWTMMACAFGDPPPTYSVPHESAGVGSASAVPPPQSATPTGDTPVKRSRLGVAR